MTDRQNILRAEEIIRKLEKKEESIVRGSLVAQVLEELLSVSIRTFKAAKDSGATMHQLADYGRYVIDAYEDLRFRGFTSESAPPKKYDEPTLKIREKVENKDELKSN